MPALGPDDGEVSTPMAVIETPPETVAAASASAAGAQRAQPTGLAGVLGTGDHKVIGRLYIVTALVFGIAIVVLGGLLGFEATAPGTIDVFTSSTVFQSFTLFRVSSVFLLAIPLVLGVAMAIVPLQVGARSIAFPRAAAASYWGWLMGSILLLVSYAINGGPAGGRSSGVNLFLASFGLVVVSIVVAAIALATTVLALRHTGLSLSRTPLFAWSVAVASIMWVLTLPVLGGVLVLLYVDHRHGAASLGGNAAIYSRLLWVLRNPQIYILAVPALGFAGDALATTAKARLAPRGVAIGAIGVFGVAGFGAFLAGADLGTYDSVVVVAMSLMAVIPVLALLGVVGDVLRRGTFRVTAGALDAVSALLVLLVTTAAAAIGSFPTFETAGTIFDLGISHGVVLASVIASLGGIHWWSTKIARQPANEALGRVAPLVLLVGSLAVVVADVVSGFAGEGAELHADWTGGIEAMNWVALVGIGVVALGLLTSLGAVLPALKAGEDVPADPWEGQTLEWLAPSPPPLANFDGDLAPVTSAEPLVDLRQEK